MLNSFEDAKEYLGTIEKSLNELSEKAIEAKLFHHAALWNFVLAALLHSNEEMEMLVDVVATHSSQRMNALIAKKDSEKSQNPFDSFGDESTPGLRR